MNAERRPAEVSAIVAAVLAVAVAFGVELDEAQVAALIGLVGLVPGAVTWFVVWRRGKAA